MPSLRYWYEKLSAAMHAANQDDELFKQAQAAIVEHFDFRRIYKVPDETPAAMGQTVADTPGPQTKE